MRMVLATLRPRAANPGADADTDNDGIIDSLDEDDDGDGYSDAIEDELGTDGKDPDDTPEDQDNDLLPDTSEDTLGTDPTNPDTDGDGVLDGEMTSPILIALQILMATASPIK